MKKDPGLQMILIFSFDCPGNNFAFLPYLILFNYDLTLCNIPVQGQGRLIRCKIKLNGFQFPVKLSEDWKSVIPDDL